MKKLNIKALSLGVTAAIVSSGAAIAAAPGTGFDTWSSDTAGNITTPCPAGFTCTTIATDNGFLQRQMTNGTDTFVQSVLLEADATTGQFAANSAAANFSDESFIKMTTPGSGGNGNTQGGLANKSKIGDTGFSQNTELLIGSFFNAAGGDQNFIVDQVVSGADAAGTASTDFFTAFNFSQVTTAMAGDTTVTESNALKLSSLTQDAVTGEKQAFNFSRSTDIAALQTAFNANALNVNTTAISGADLAGTNSFETIWVGQNFGSQAFGVQDARTQTGAAGAVSIDKKNSFSSTGFTGTAAATGFDWNTALGSGVYAPSF